MKLTKTQEGILNLDIAVEGAVSVLCGAMIFLHPFSIDEIQHALNKIVEINDALRLRIDVENKEQYLTAAEQINFDHLCFIDETSFEHYANTYAKTPIMLDGRLFDIKIVSIGQRHGILYKFHHVICDAWCFGIMRQQLFQILECHLTPEAGSFISFFDKYNTYLSGRKYEKDRLYFIQQLESVKDRVYLPQNSFHSFDADNASFIINKPTLRALFDLADQTNLSVYVLLLTSFGIAFNKISFFDSCFYLGTPVLNRSTEIERHTVGPLINDVPLLIDINYDLSILDNAKRIAENVLNVFRHQKFNYPMLQDSLIDQYHISSLYDIVFSYQDEIEVLPAFPAKWYKNGIQIEALQIHIDHRNDSDSLEINYNYNREKYSKRTITELHHSFLNTLHFFLSDKNTIIKDIPLLELRPAELNSFAAGPVVPIPEKSVYELFEEQAAGTDTAQIRDGEKTYALCDLKTAAEKVDLFIRSRTGDKKQVIGVLCDRSFAQLAAIYGIVRGGSAYLPLSPDFPPERIRILLEKADCSLVLADGKYLSLTEKAVSVGSILAAAAPAVVPAPAAVPDDTLYVIFTSGSTGTPKGAMVTNRSAVNRIGWMADRYWDKDTVVMLKTPYTFDVSVWEIFGFAISGFSLQILPPEAHYSMSATLNAVAEGRVTDMHFVPTVFGSFLEHLKSRPEEREKLRSLKNVFLSGETLHASSVNEFASFAPAGAKIHNLYGPAECAVDVTFFDCDKTEEDPVPIGKPIQNTRIYVLDKYLQPVPVGVTGQICIAGTNVGQGYLGGPALTTEKFIDDPYGEGKMYLTGDLGYWREDGNLVFVGRNDFQVKINGQRVELGEIETALAGVDGVQLAAVKEQTAEDSQVLTAYYTGEEKPARELREKLGEILPRYMVPQIFVHLDAMPLTVSGKIDRNALPEADLINVSDASEFLPPETETEMLLAEVIAGTLGVEKVGRNDNFFALGGDSIRAIYVASRLQSRGWLLSVPDLMRSPTVAAMAEKLRQVSPADKGISEETDLIPLPPMANAYFHRAPHAPERFSQGCLIYTDADETAVRRGLDLLIERHPILRAVVKENALTVPQDHRGEKNLFSCVSVSPEEGGIDEARRRLLQKAVSFDLASGPLTDAAFAVTPEGNLLRLTAHHLVVDLFSWEILLRELLSLLTGNISDLPERTASFAQWMKALTRYKDTMSPSETAFWEEKQAALEHTAPLCKETDTALPGEGSTLCLDEELTGRLLYLEQKDNVRLDISLLAALGRAATQLTGTDTGICVETLGRPQLPEPIRIDGTVGWFTACYPIVIKREPDETKQLFAVRRTIQEAPCNGIGWLLKYGELPKNADLIYNFYRLPTEDTNLSSAEPIIPEGESAYDMLFPGAISVDCEYRGGRIVVRFRCPPMPRPATVLRDLSREFENAVREIAKHTDFSGIRADAADGYSDNALSYDELTTLESMFNGTDEL